MTEALGVIRLFAFAAVVSLALGFPSGANGSGTTTAEPTLTLKRDCETFAALNANTVDVILSGFPPFTTFLATLDINGNTATSEFTTDANGSFDSHTVGHIGLSAPATFTASVTWEGGVLTESLFVDCSKPALKADCNNGGWRDFPDFKNQGQCVAFVERGSR